jgi:hypothetical protein
MTQGRSSFGSEKVTTKRPGGAGRRDSNRLQGKSAGGVTGASTTASGMGSSRPESVPQPAAVANTATAATRATEQISKSFIG